MNKPFVGESRTPAFKAVIVGPEFRATALTRAYRASFDVLPLDWHTHMYFVIPSGIIDGINRTFTIVGRHFEVLLNGLAQTYLRTPTGFELAEAPKPGDLLWCQVVI